MRRLALIVTALPLAGCAEPLPTEALTSGGTWRVAIVEAPALGEEALVLSVDDAGDAAAAEDIDLLVVASMPGMTHGGSADHADMRAPGLFEAELAFDMPGTWAIDGEVTAGEVAEDFTLWVAVDG